MISLNIYLIVCFKINMTLWGVSVPGIITTDSSRYLWQEHGEQIQLSLSGIFLLCFTAFAGTLKIFPTLPPFISLLLSFCPLPHLSFPLPQHHNFMIFIFILTFRLCFLVLNLKSLLLILMFLHYTIYHHI